MREQKLRGVRWALFVVAVFASLLASVTNVAAQTGAFEDVPGDAYYSSPVAELAAQGVFAGTLCEDGFCPGEAMDRKTMSVWVVRLLDGQDPPAISQARFNDVDADGFYARFIERLAELGVTRGCGDGSSFCPDRVVTRAEMAVFLSRAYSLPEGPDPGFSDVPADAWYAADVARLAASRITVGCGDGSRFCPSRDTTRAQMATFLARAAGAEPSGRQESRYVSLAAGDRHLCGLRIDGAIDCWGENDFGQAQAPVAAYSALDAGADHTCALRTDRTVACWGNNASGQTEAPSGQFRHVSAGSSHSCAVRTEGTFDCWGDRRTTRHDKQLIGTTSWHRGYLQVATGSEQTCALYQPTTDQVAGATFCWRFDDLAAHWSSYDETLRIRVGRLRSIDSGNTGSGPTCGLDTRQNVRCWSVLPGYQEVQQTFNGNYSSIAVGADHACSLTFEDQSIVCWSLLDHSRYTPDEIEKYDTSLQLLDAPAGTFLQVVVGNGFSCALRKNFSPTCWDRDEGRREHDPSEYFGTEVLQGSIPEVSVSLSVTGAEVAASQLTVVGLHACGVLADATVTCWGDWARGVLAPPAGQYTAVTSFSTYTCGLLEDHTVRCWGANQFRIDETDLFRQFSAGRRHACGIRTDQTLVCFGANELGQTDAPEGEFSSLDAYGNFSCAVRVDQTLACWGGVPTGTWGAGLGTSRLDSRQDRFLAVSSGETHACGLRIDRTIVCWGGDYNVPGASWDDTVYHDGRTTSPAGYFLSVSAGSAHTCALRLDQHVVCWGGNIFGQIDAPVGKFLAVSAGRRVSCGIRTDKTVICWGDDWWRGSNFAPRLRFMSEIGGSETASALIPREASCEISVEKAGVPGPPSDLEVLRVDAFNLRGKSVRPIDIGWKNPCRGGIVDYYSVKWRLNFEDFTADRQAVIGASDVNGNYLFRVPNDIDSIGTHEVYEVQVTAVNDEGTSPATSVIVPTPANAVIALLERVVDVFEQRYPWLTEVWPVINSRNFVVSQKYCGPGSAFALGCASPHELTVYIASPEVRIFDDSDWARREPLGWSSPRKELDLLHPVNPRFGYTALHEMAHVYEHWMADRDEVQEILVHLRQSCDSDSSVSEGFAELPEVLMYQDGVASYRGGDPRTCIWGKRDDKNDELWKLARRIFAP